MSKKLKYSMNYNKLLTIVSKTYFGFNFQKPLCLNLRLAFSQTMLLKYQIKSIDQKELAKLVTKQK